MFARRFLTYVPVLFCFSLVISAQNLEFERTRHKDILRIVKDDVKKNYFDPNFKGIDLEAKHRLAIEKLSKAESIGQMSGIIAQFLMDFEDSHLYFAPPGKVNKTDYGFNFRMFGENCFVTHVDPKSDAEKVGLQVGDQLYAIGGYEITRENRWKLQYLLYRLRPQAGVDVIAGKPGMKPVKYSVAAKVTEGRKVMDLTVSGDLNTFIRESENAYTKSTRQYYQNKLEGVFIWKMPSFSLEPLQVDEMMGKAKKAPAMIIDMRGNSGGRVDMVLRLIGNIFDQDVKVADEKRRKETKEVIAKSRGKDSYTGKIIALIDGSSASASEVFARVLQLEKRGQVFGDRSSGAVMESRFFGRELGIDRIIMFGTSVTVADLIMKDGKSLEKIGVEPDLKLIPTGRDLAAKRDVVMSKALMTLGLDVSPEKAGAMFPQYEDDDDN